MKKLVFGIFAHPDDEAFGPSGTLLTEVKHGNEVHLLALTAGQTGANPDNTEDLASTRRSEWQTAGALIGASSMHELGYQDGQLCNQTMPEAAEKIVQIVRDTARNEQAIEIEFMALDLNGLTGHIDHIVATRAACLAFYRLKASDPRLSRIRLACIPKSRLPTHNTDWLYMEAGRDEPEINETIDARQYRDEIITIMRAHHSQRADFDTHLVRRGDEIGLDYFIVKN